MRGNMIEQTADTSMENDRQLLGRSFWPSMTDGRRIGLTLLSAVH